MVGAEPVDVGLRIGGSAAGEFFARREWNVVPVEGDAADGEADGGIAARSDAGNVGSVRVDAVELKLLEEGGNISGGHAAELLLEGRRLGAVDGELQVGEAFELGDHGGKLGLLLVVERVEIAVGGKSLEVEGDVVRIGAGSGRRHGVVAAGEEREVGAGVPDGDVHGRELVGGVRVTSRACPDVGLLHIVLRYVFGQHGQGLHFERKNLLQCDVDRR